MLGLACVVGVERGRGRGNLGARLNSPFPFQRLPRRLCWGHSRALHLAIKSRCRPTHVMGVVASVCMYKKYRNKRKKKQKDEDEETRRMFIMVHTITAKQKIKSPPVGFEPTTFELEVQHASPLRHGGRF